jgi:acyl carrier protein
MTDKAIQALKTIATFPITDPKNMDAINLKKLAVSALAGIEKEVLVIEKNDEPQFTTDIDKGVLKVLMDTLGFESSEIKIGDNLVKDLFVDELDMIELCMRLEETFNFEISDQQALEFKTVKDIINFVEKEEAC